MIIALDYETYYDQEYSLSKMRETDYVLDPRFETIMCAVKEGSGPSDVFVGHKAVADRLGRIDWSRAALLNHNARFDGAILAWLYGHVPALYLDTLSMARSMTHAVIGRSSLKAVANYLGIGQKGDEVVRAKGKRLADFTPYELERYAHYCNNDNELCWQIFQRFRPHFPTEELAVIDMSLRMFIQPQVELNPHRLRAHRTVVRVNKQEVMDRVAHIDKSVFSSTAKFTQLLESKGVVIPLKVSPATGQLIPATAKNDVAFKELCDDPDQPLEVQALLAARTNAKSTIDETRADTLLNLAQRQWPGAMVGRCPIPLKYYGAHTGRFSGDGGYNFQNLRRRSPLKAAIRAPEGYVVVHRDASQIEARMVAWLASCQRLLSAFRAGRDVYSEFATGVYGREITKKDEGPRFCGKTCILGLGYQTGPFKLKNTLYIGNGGISVTVDLTEAQRLVRYYRSTYPEIPALWRRCDWVISELAVRAGRQSRGGMDDRRPIPAIELGQDALWLPNGMPIAYPNIRMNSDPMQTGYVYDSPRGEPESIYGGKMTENVTQALARVVITEIMLRVRAETKARPFLTTHDSLDYCVPESEAEWWHDYLARQFAVVPEWAPGLPLASEGGWGHTLAKAERGRPDKPAVDYQESRSVVWKKTPVVA